MEQVRDIYRSASDRLANKHDLVSDVYEKIKNHSLRFLDEDNIKRRINRLLDNPLVEKVLADKGVASEFRAFEKLDSLSEKGHSELERVVNGSDFIPIWFLTRGNELRRTVARIKVRNNGNNYCGTGFLIGPGVLITNFHVLDFTDQNGDSIEKVLPNVTVEFDYEEKFDGSMERSISFDLDYETLLLTSQWYEFDYVVVALKPTSRDGSSRIEEFGYNRLAGDLGKIAKGEPVYIIQHPNGQPKQLVLQNNRLIDRDEDLPYLTYEADTHFGTSGAPVFNGQWEVVALHHSTEIARNANGAILAKDGSVWDSSMGSAAVKFLSLNEGVRVSRILADLQKKYAGFKGAQQNSPLEICSPQGLALLDAVLQTRAGVPPVDLVAPVPIENAPVLKSVKQFPQPD